ncbi:MAG: flagellar brake protein [Clostridiales bacterium]|jgi:c-di-GMP-binding flagellar brake protein YcgR|nr:flagellar brake protein [Clostridiales bacterium]
MSYKYIKIGDRIEVTEKDGCKALFSLVEHMPEPGELLLKTPVINGRLAGAPDGAELSVAVFTENGIYKFGAYVIRKFKQDGFSLTHIKLSSEFERVQRRDSYRLKCEAPLSFMEVEAICAPFAGEGAFSGIIRDISGGGACVVSNYPLMEGALIKGVIELGDETALVTGKVLEARSVPNTRSAYKFQYRVEFVSLSDELMAAIMRYILEGQRKQLLLRWKTEDLRHG